MESPSTLTSSCRVPSTESYFVKCASVLVSVRSLTATNSISGSCRAARTTLRPIRPKPLMPTFTDIKRVLSPWDFRSYGELIPQDNKALVYCRICGHAAVAAYRPAPATAALRAAHRCRTLLRFRERTLEHLRVRRAFISKPQIYRRDFEGQFLAVRQQRHLPQLRQPQTIGPRIEAGSRPERQRRDLVDPRALQFRRALQQGRQTQHIVARRHPASKQRLDEVGQLFRFRGERLKEQSRLVQLVAVGRFLKKFESLGICRILVGLRAGKTEFSKGLFIAEVHPVAERELGVCFLPENDMGQFMAQDCRKRSLVGKRVEQAAADHDRVAHAESFEWHGK